MSKKVIVRLFFAKSCGCKPNNDVAALEDIAGKLVEKFGEEKLEFEAYSEINLKKFPYLGKAADKDGSIALPFVSVGEKVMAQGAIPKYSELENEVAKCLKAD